ncbi:MAG: hypothetical protein ACOYJD_04325 [Christensenellales bacterium]|jgi:vacuolar-type H+-ATPase subunit E/Vma4
MDGGEGMSESAIDIIRNAESEAERMLMQASEESERIKEEAVTEAAKTSEIEEAAANEAARSIISSAKQKRREKLINAEKALLEELELLHRHAEARQEAAVEAVIDSLI